MLNTNNFTTFLPIFPFQILSKVREKSESFEGVFQRQKYFIGSYMFAAISANNGRQENSKISRIVRLGDPSIGFLKNNTKKKNISAAEKPFKTLAIFSSFVLERT